ncbi:MAG: glycosyltransferase family 4 protein [Polyangiaceae bacterium]|nr:glycosyltransferase family 4 protein [Polyangiaceae bacterium]
MVRPKLVYIVTVPTTARVLLRGQLAFMREAGFDVTVVSSPGPELEEVGEREGVRTVGVQMAREIDVVRDARAFSELRATIARLAPDIVNASTPKAGLLGMMSASLCRVPVRIYLLRGLRFEGTRGAKRWILEGTERVAAGCANRVVCVSESVRAGYLERGLTSLAKCTVLGSGSSNGVDLDRFDPERAKPMAEALRAKFGISSDAMVFGFVGRPVADKGIRELIFAWEKARKVNPSARLLIVGAGFAGDTVDQALAQWMRGRDDIIAAGEVSEPAPYYALMSVLLFPSYREGFPNAPLEAAAMGVPTIGFSATGTRDVIVDGQTGLLVPVGDGKGLAASLERYVRDAAERVAHGKEAQTRARALFDRRRIWGLWLAEYTELLAKRGLRLPRN